MRDLSLVIVTDVDGTLIDHDSYSYEEAWQGLDAAGRAGVPVILCSSKTRAEIEALQCELAMSGFDWAMRQPFVSENGGALFVPFGYFGFELPSSRHAGGCEAIEFGSRYGQVVGALRRTAIEVGVKLQGFSDMSAADIAHQCHCSLVQAALAKCREYDEPYRVTDGSAAARRELQDALTAQGYRCTSGSRFHHVMGHTDKGHATRYLRRLYERETGGRVVTVGLGDSLNDLSLLSAVDVPVIVRNKQADAVRLQHLLPGGYVTEHRGPKAWSRAVCHLVSALGPHTHAVGQ